MLKHVVFLTFKNELSPQEVNSILKAVHDLRQPIPEIISFERITNISKEGLDQGFNCGLILGFKNEADRDTYLFHPEHVRVAQDIVFPALQNGKDSIVVFDYFEQTSAVMA